MSEPEGTANFSLHGSLSTPGTAVGTLRIDMAFNTPIGVVECSTGDVSWNAS